MGVGTIRSLPNTRWSYHTLCYGFATYQIIASIVVINRHCLVYEYGQWFITSWRHIARHDIRVLFSHYGSLRSYRHEGIIVIITLVNIAITLLALMLMKYGFTEKTLAVYEYVGLAHGEH